MKASNFARFLSDGMLNIGVDLVEIPRFKKFDVKSRVAKNLFTPKEIKDCLKKMNTPASLAARFAAKEAVKKCLRENIKYNLIEISSEKNGRPKVRLLDASLNDKYYLHISLTHSKSIAQAVCLSVSIN